MSTLAKIVFLTSNKLHIWKSVAMPTPKTSDLLMVLDKKKLVKINRLHCFGTLNTILASQSIGYLYLGQRDGLTDRGVSVCTVVLAFKPYPLS